MSDTFRQMLETARAGIDRRTYRAGKRLARFARAVAYALDRLGQSQAAQIAYDVEWPARAFPLIVLTADEVVEEARERFEDHPELPRLCLEAAQRVASKWEDYTEVRGGCCEWAMDLVADYAKSEGIHLVAFEED